MSRMKFKTAEGLLHVAPEDIASVLAKPDGSGVVTFKHGIPSVTVKDVTPVIRLLDEAAPAAPRSLFEAIFG